jgi:hypothetical protein
MGVEFDEELGESESLLGVAAIRLVHRLWLNVRSAVSKELDSMMQEDAAGEGVDSRGSLGRGSDTIHRASLRPRSLLPREPHSTSNVV